MEFVISYTRQFRNAQEANRAYLTAGLYAWIRPVNFMSRQQLTVTFRRQGKNLPDRVKHDAVTQHSLRHLAVGALDLFL